MNANYKSGRDVYKRHYSKAGGTFTKENTVKRAGRVRQKKNPYMACPFLFDWQTTAGAFSDLDFFWKICYNKINRVRPRTGERSTMENILECMGLTKDYKGIRALDNLTFSVPDRGCIVGLLGPNGSGKTTLIKLLTGLLTPTSGQIRIAGLPVGTETKSVVAYLPDSNFLSDGFTVQEEIQYYKDFFEDFDEEKAKTMIAELGVNPTQKVRALSKGTKEKLGLLLTLARNAKLFILDEPIAGVDPAARDYILKTIVSHKNADATMIICTHLIGDIEPVLDYVLFLQNGKVVLQGGANEIRKGEGKTIDQLFREVFRW